VTFDLVLTAVVVVVTVLALAREWLAPSLIIFGGMVLLMLTGVITPAEALAGFANPAPMTVAALFIMARAVEKTGVIQPLLARALRVDSGERGNLARLLTPVAASSAFLNNTPIVAMLISPVTSWAEQRGRSVSRLLMPISFATMLGGMITLIGTSTNLVVSGLLVGAGYEPFGMFELTWVGLPVAIVGVAFLVFWTASLLPDRKGIKKRFEEGMREFTVEMLVDTNGPADGRSVSDVGLRHLEGVFLAWIRRGDAIIAPVGPEEVLRSGDRLGFVGGVDRVVDLQGIRGLRSAEHKHTAGVSDATHGFFEAVVAMVSPLAGETLKSADFRERYQATVLAIHRSGNRVSGKLGEVVLEPGDTLLLLAERSFASHWRDRSDFLLVSGLEGSPPVESRKGVFVVAITGVVVLLAALEVIPILQGSLAAALAMVLTGILTPHEARGAVDLDVLIMIAASFALGTAIESSGLAALVAGWIVQPAMVIGPIGVLAAIVLATLALTELITNNAAAVLIFPIGIAAAAQAGVDPRPFAIALALAASASFLTPIGYQTNTMVYGPGGYRFGDYARLGFPLTILVFFAIVGITGLKWNLF
jgi:di/tricarboxylate transporter